MFIIQCRGEERVWRSNRKIIFLSGKSTKILTLHLDIYHLWSGDAPCFMALVRATLRPFLEVLTSSKILWKGPEILMIQDSKKKVMRRLRHAGMFTISFFVRSHKEASYVFCNFRSRPFPVLDYSEKRLQQKCACCYAIIEFGLMLCSVPLWSTKDSNQSDQMNIIENSQKMSQIAKKSTCLKESKNDQNMFKIAKNIANWSQK